MKYRLLKENEPICADDQFLEDDCITWTTAKDGAHLFIGVPYRPGFFQPMRRPLAA